MTPSSKTRRLIGSALSKFLLRIRYCRELILSCSGGSEIVHRAMTEVLTSKPVLYQRATVFEESDDGNSITVTFDGRRNPNPSAQTVAKRKYSNIISTMTFACLRMVDLKNAGLNYGQKNAIKSLMYTPSIKVGMQFKSAWWERLGIVGGQSSTDLPIRDCVYPS